MHTLTCLSPRRRPHASEPWMLMCTYEDRFGHRVSVRNAEKRSSGGDPHSHEPPLGHADLCPRGHTPTNHRKPHVCLQLFQCPRSPGPGRRESKPRGGSLTLRTQPSHSGLLLSSGERIPKAGVPPGAPRKVGAQPEPADPGRKRSDQGGRAQEDRGPPTRNPRSRCTAHRVELLLELLIRIVDAKLLKAVHLECLKPAGRKEERTKSAIVPVTEGLPGAPQGRPHPLHSHAALPRLQHGSPCPALVPREATIAGIMMTAL